MTLAPGAAWQTGSQEGLQDMQACLNSESAWGSGGGVGCGCGVWCGGGGSERVVNAWHKGVVARMSLIRVTALIALSS